MTENNDKLITRFFQERKQEIEDKGFSRRVMHKLPNRERKLSNLWTTFCIILSCILFFLFGGTEVLFDIFRKIFASGTVAYIENMDPISLAIVVFILITMGIKRITSLE